LLHFEILLRVEVEVLTKSKLANPVRNDPAVFSG
jgi:hypothetical protein